MMNIRPRVMVASDTLNNRLANDLELYLTKRAEFEVMKEYFSSSKIIPEPVLANCQWLVVALPEQESVGSAKKQVEIARDLVFRRRLQGVLAVTDTQASAEVMRSYPTLRIYSIIAQNEDKEEQRFAKIY